jgi:pimeloyl-ACP methyl ester carboxylesterase
VTRTERLVSVGDTELHLREWGADGPPILFWHALGDHTGLQMIEAGPILAGEYGYHVIAPDAPGFGRSPRLEAEHYEMPGLVEVARRLLDALDLDRIVWAGSSWGAALGVHFAATYPQRLAALVLIDGGFPGHVIPEGETLEQIQAHWRSQPGFTSESWTAVLDESREHFPRWSPELEEYVRSAYREGDGQVVSIVGPDVFAAARYGIDAQDDVLPALAESRVPTLALAATEGKTPSDHARRERFAEQVPHAHVRVVQGVPHLMLEARPEETAREIGDWLKALPYA